MSTVDVGRAQRSAQLTRPGRVLLTNGHTMHPKHLLNALQYSEMPQWSWFEQPFSTVLASVDAEVVAVASAAGDGVGENVAGVKQRTRVVQSGGALHHQLSSVKPKCLLWVE